MSLSVLMASRFSRLNKAKAASATNTRGFLLFHQPELGELMKDILTGIGAYFAMTKVFKMLTDPLKQVPGDWRFLRLSIVVCAILTIAFSALDYSTRCLESIVEHWPF